MDDTSPSELRKVLKDSYVVWFKGDGKRKYVGTIYNDSIGTTTNIDDAMKVPELDTASAIRKIVSSYNNYKDTEFHISHIQIIVEDIIPGVSTF